MVIFIYYFIESVGGTSGEAMSLSVEERIELLETWIQTARPLGLKIMVQVGGAPFPDVMKLVSCSKRL
jgi:N-acetylneuraminate lyase